MPNPSGSEPDSSVSYITVRTDTVATYQTHLPSYTTVEYRVTSYTTYYTQYCTVSIVFHICLYCTVIIRAVVHWRGKLIWPPLQSCNILYQCTRSFVREGENHLASSGDPSGLIWALSSCLVQYRKFSRLP